MFSRTAEYAMRAVLVLAAHRGGNLLNTDEIANAVGAPRNYMGKTLNILVSHGILTSARGPTGGFALAIAPELLTVANIVDVFAGPRPQHAKCLIRNALCDPANPCTAHERWTEITVLARQPLMRTTIAELSGNKFNKLGALPADQDGVPPTVSGRKPKLTGMKS